MSDELRPAQFNVLCQPLATNLKREACIRGQGYNTHTSTRLTVVGVRRRVVELSGMLGSELVGKASHGGRSGAVLLKESHVSMSGGKPIGMGLKVGDILRLDDGDARWRRRVGQGFRQGLHERTALLVAVLAWGWRAGRHSLL